MRAKDYKIIEEKHKEGLEHLVCLAIKEGWQPLGAPFFGDSWWYQAMIVPNFG